MSKNTTEEILKERGVKYGDFVDNGNVSEAMILAIKQTCSKDFEEKPLWFQNAIRMICCKISRAISGDAMYEDNFIDISGYALLVKDCIKKHNSGDGRYMINGLYLKQINGENNEDK